MRYSSADTLCTTYGGKTAYYCPTGVTAGMPSGCSNHESTIGFWCCGCRRRGKRMAIIKCPDCSSEVSDHAPACPKCGRSFKPAAGDTVLTRNRGCADLVLLLLLLAAVAGVGLVFCGHH